MSVPRPLSIPQDTQKNLTHYANNELPKNGIFSYHRWESTRHLRQQLSFPNVTEIFHARSRKFLSNCINGVTLNEVVRRLAVFTKLENVED